MEATCRPGFLRYLVDGMSQASRAVAMNDLSDCKGLPRYHVRCDSHASIPSIHAADRSCPVARLARDIMPGRWPEAA